PCVGAASAVAAPRDGSSRGSVSILCPAHPPPRSPVRMSGFVGIIHTEEAAEPALLSRLTEFLAFRGPDARGTWLSGPAGFGFTRLGVAPEAAHRRPPPSPDGRLVIVADARLDGRSDLLRRLAGCGHPLPPSAPDAQLLGAAYRAWGEACPEHLLGDFAFALWDSREQRLVCARDHF